MIEHVKLKSCWEKVNGICSAGEHKIRDTEKCQK